MVSEEPEYQTEIQAPKNKDLVTKHWCKSQVGPAAMLTEVLKLSIMTGMVSDEEEKKIEVLKVSLVLHFLLSLHSTQ